METVGLAYLCVCSQFEGAILDGRLGLGSPVLLPRVLDMESLKCEWRGLERLGTQCLVYYGDQSHPKLYSVFFLMKLSSSGLTFCHLQVAFQSLFPLSHIWVLESC